MGDTECPQFIGSIFLDDVSIQGEWVVTDQPEWLDVYVDGTFVDFYFNCFIDDTSSQLIDGDVQFNFVVEDDEESEEEEIEPFHVAVTGEIINPEEEE